MTLAKTLRAGAVSATLSVGASACAPAPIPLSEPAVPVERSEFADAARAWCVTASDNMLGLGDLVADASQSWGVNLPVLVVTRSLPDWCVPVIIVKHTPTKDAPWVGLTTTTVDPWRPLLVRLSSGYWDACPLSRARLVRHEVGHALGHLEHTVAGLMSETTDCNTDADDAPTYYEIKRAAARREGVSL